MGLAEKNCVPCRGGVPPLDADAIAGLLPQLEPGWEAVDHHQQNPMHEPTREGNCPCVLKDK